jgi:hypothetical protein
MLVVVVLVVALVLVLVELVVVVMVPYEQPLSQLHRALAIQAVAVVELVVLLAF